MSERATTATDHIDVKSGELVEKVKALLHEGNVRRIVIKDGDGEEVMDVPLSFGLLGLLVAPKLAAVGGLAALAADYSIDVEHDEPAAADTTAL